MANHKSAKKRARQDVKCCRRNKETKGAVRTFEKKLMAAISSGDRDQASKLLITFNSAIGKASQKGIYHARNAARKISRLSKRIHNMQA